MRLRNYDYAQNGAYFVTICAYQRENKFGAFCRDNPSGCPSIAHTVLGNIVAQEIAFIENRYHICFEKYIVMPNHFHAIVTITAQPTNGHPQGVSLQQIIGGYKSRVSSEYLKICKAQNMAMGKIWQPRFHDHVIRDEKEYQKIWEYIDTNPYKWQDDCYYVT